MQGMVMCQHDMEMPLKKDKIWSFPTEGNVSLIDGSFLINKQIMSAIDINAQQKYAFP